jgi:hypothetical protein
MSKERVYTDHVHPWEEIVDYVGKYIQKKGTALEITRSKLQIRYIYYREIKQVKPFIKNGLAKHWKSMEL